MEWFFINVALNVWNMGLAAGLILGCMLVLRPVLVKVLTAQQRAWFGVMGWYGASLGFLYSLMNWLHVFPVTFQDLITPRTEMGSSTPAYLPVSYDGAGEYALTLPGGKAFWVELTDERMLALVLVWLAGAAALGFVLWRRTRRLKTLGRQGQLLADDDPLLLRSLSRQPDDEPVGVRLCRGLPTSFVYQNGERIDGKKHNMIYLQEELPPQRRELVLRHEWNHIRLYHGWMKGWANIALILYWWNPILWVAYYYFCRDLELACDERTLCDLAGPEERKQYAQTLVELAAGKMLWDVPLAFGECDAVPRVKAAVAWHKPTGWEKAGKWCACVLVFLFFVGGPRDIPYLSQELVRYWQQEAVEVTVPSGWAPEERWLRADGRGSVILLAKDIQGTWHKSSYLWDKQDKDFKTSDRWMTLDEAPDLTGFQQGLW